MLPGLRFLVQAGHLGGQNGAMRLLFLILAFWLGSCVSSPLPLDGGQVHRDRANDWQHAQVTLVVDHDLRHIRGTAFLHVRSLEPATHTIALDLGPLRLSGAVKDSAGRALQVLSSTGSQRELKLNTALALGEEEVLEVQYDGTSGAGLGFEQSAAGQWVRLYGGAFFPHVQGRGHFPTLDVSLFVDGELTVLGPGQRLGEPGGRGGPGPAHFRIARPSDPRSMNFLVGPMQPLALSGDDEGWCMPRDQEASKVWAQAWMRARATDAHPGAPCRVGLLPASLGLSGWQGGWLAIPLGPAPNPIRARDICRRLVIEQNLRQGLLPDSDTAHSLVSAMVIQAQASEGFDPPESEPNRMRRGLQAMEQELGAAAFETLRTDFLQQIRGQAFGVWEWARFAERRSGLSAQALFETLTGR